MTTSATRLLDAATHLASQGGYHGVGINEVLARAGVGNGSLYHAFPEGKPELMATAITAESDRMTEALAALLERGPDEAVRGFFRAAERELLRSGFEHGCRVTTALADGADVPALQQAGAAILERWGELVSDALHAAGASVPQARSTADAIVALYVGAWITSRTSRSTAPMRSSQEAALVLVRTALGV